MPQENCVLSDGSVGLQLSFLQDLGPPIPGYLDSSKFQFMSPQAFVTTLNLDCFFKFRQCGLRQ